MCRSLTTKAVIIEAPTARVRNEMRENIPAKNKRNLFGIIPLKYLMVRITSLHVKLYKY